MLGLDYIARHHPKTRKKITKSFVPTEWFCNAWLLMVCLSSETSIREDQRGGNGMDGRLRTQTPEDQLFRVSKTDLCRGLLSFPPVLWLPVWAILHTAMHTTITMP